jgi:hypothetical protein
VWRTVQVAIVYPAVAGGIVFEHVAVSRHARVRMFSQVCPALQWLLPGISVTCLMDH